MKKLLFGVLLLVLFSPAVFAAQFGGVSSSVIDATLSTFDTIALRNTALATFDTIALRNTTLSTFETTAAHDLSMSSTLATYETGANARTVEAGLATLETAIKARSVEGGLATLESTAAHNLNVSQTLATYESVAAHDLNMSQTLATFDTIALRDTALLTMASTASLTAISSEVTIPLDKNVIATMIASTAVTAEQVVSLSTGDASGLSVQTTVEGSCPLVFGVARTSAGIGGQLFINVTGIAMVTCDATSAIVAGDPLSTFTSGGQAKKGSWGTGAVFGIALQNLASGGGRIRARIF